MDLSTFTTETMDYLWRPNDTALQTNMPKLIRTAENRMRVDLKLTDTDVSETWQVNTYPEFAMPANLGVLTSISWTGRGAGKYQTPANFFRAVPPHKVLYPSTQRSLSMLDYTVKGTKLVHRWESATASTPVEAEVVYTPRPASLVDGDDSLFNEYTAMYEAGVYYECCKFLREEERAAMFDTTYQQRMVDARFEQSNRKFAGGPLRMSMPGVVA